MQKKCDYCDNYYDDTKEQCPYCGAPNDHIARSSDQQPKTIEELKQWVIDHHLPDENITRFFIGKDIKEPRAFGIYQDLNTGNFIVYKNKDNGQRAIRYEGKDEAYAVNELYQRLRSEISNQKQQNQSRPRNKNIPQKKSKGFLVSCFALVIICLAFFIVFSSFSGPSNGYYSYRGNQYYYQDNDWYYYDENTNDWYYANDLDSNFTDNAQDYYQSSPNSNTSDFEDSDYWTDSSDYDSDWDNDSSWDFSDSWDSSSSDWSSDW